MRARYWTIVIIVVLLAGALAAFGREQRPRASEASPQAAQIARDLLAKPYTEHGKNYDISAAYPTTTPAGAAGAEQMQEWIITEIGTFKARAASPAHSSLTITYEASSTGPLSSYLFTENTNGAVSTKMFVFTATTS